MAVWQTTVRAALSVLGQGTKQYLYRVLPVLQLDFTTAYDIKLKYPQTTIKRFENKCIGPPPTVCVYKNMNLV